MTRIATALVGWLAPCLLAAVTVAGGAHAQSISGCGSTAIAKGDFDRADKLAKAADCFAKAKVAAVMAEQARRDRIAALTAPSAPKGGAASPAAVASVKIPDPIPSNFDTAADIAPSNDYVGGNKGAIPSSAAPDVVGAFRFSCGPGHLAYDDPIVYPGQPGKSHLHQFFGNTLANANSTYQSLRTSGDSSCMNPLNRSGYWISAMLTGKGQVVRPDYVTIYYKRRPVSDPGCFVEAVKGCADLPRGLRFIFGYNMATAQPGDSPGDFLCANANSGAAASAHPTMVEASRDCPAGLPQIGARLHAPECWDGVHLDSPDHRSHMAYPGYGSWGYLKCPSGYPYVVPTFTLMAWYTLDASFTRDGNPTWHLSSDEMQGMVMTPGSTLHADWWGAWDDATMARWTAACINKLLNCSGGDLGDGGQLKQVWKDTQPRLVPMPVRPVADGVALR